MTPIEKYFGHIVVINLQRRPDRWLHVLDEMSKLGIKRFERFEAIDAGPTDGNRGCSASHKAVMKMIVDRGWDKCLVLEDDFACCIDDPQMRFAAFMPEIPANFDMLYLGGHFGSNPQYWQNKHLVRIGQMKTTSSYGVTRKSATELYEVVPTDTIDSIDNLYGVYNEAKECYICEPRLFVQYKNYSDLQQREMDNSVCMLDKGHIERLGKYVPR